MNLFLVSIGGGFAAALLFAAIGAGSAWAGALSYLASLPILIITLGWHQRAGLAALAIAAAVLAIIFGPTTALVYAIASGLPAWWVGFLALMGRSSADGEGPSAWLSTGALLAWIVGSAALITLAGSLAAGRLDYEAYRAALTTLIEALVRYESGVGREGSLPQVAGIEASRIVSLLVTLVPLVVAASLTLLLVVNTWLAAKIVLLSDRLPRPWPFLPATRMPLAAVGLAFAGIAATSVPGFVGVAGAAFVGAAGMGFALQGLAFLHAVTIARAGRRALLGFLYVVTALFGATMLPVLTIVGVIDSATPMRRRLAPSPTQPN